MFDDKVTFPITVTGHTGGFITHKPDGPHVEQVGFVVRGMGLVVIPRDAFDAAIQWVTDVESSPSFRYPHKETDTTND